MSTGNLHFQNKLAAHNLNISAYLRRSVYTHTAAPGEVYKIKYDYARWLLFYWGFKICQGNNT